MKDMIALNIRQPNAELIMRGKKKIEYRNKSTIKRERIYIFASHAPGQPKAFARLGLQPDDLPRGVLLGTVEIVDCKEAQAGFEWHLARPERLEKALRPKRGSLPIWFYPF